MCFNAADCFALTLGWALPGQLKPDNKVITDDDDTAADAVAADDNC